MQLCANKGRHIQRYYPFGSIFGPVIGFSGTDGGLEGVEKVMNENLVIDERKSTFRQSGRGENSTVN